MDILEFIQSDYQKSRARHPVLSFVMAALCLLAVVGVGLRGRDKWMQAFSGAEFVLNWPSWAIAIGVALLPFSGSPKSLLRSNRFAMGLVLTAGFVLSLYKTRMNGVPAEPLLPCLEEGLGFGIVLGMILSSLLFRFSSLPTHRAQQATALFCGLAATGMLSFGCDSHSLSHTLLAHWSAALGVIAFVLLGERALLAYSVRRFFKASKTSR